MRAPNKPLGRVIMIHGLRGEEPERNISKLALSFRKEGFSVCIPHYGTYDLLGLSISRWTNPRIAASLGSFVTRDDILLGHSNGATIANMITEQQRVRGCIFVNAALDVEEIPNADFTHVYYNSGDLVTRFSSLIPFTQWGAMGNRGYCGPPHPSILNIDCGNPPYDELPSVNGHSDLFHNGNLTPWARYMASLARLEII
jgi:hypothetical protein